VRKPEIWTERRVVDLGAEERLQPVAGGIAKRDDGRDAPRIGQPHGLGRDADLGGLESGCERIQRRGVLDLPAEETCAFGHGRIDDDALLAVVHPKRELRIAVLHRLEADQIGPELPPLRQIIRSEPGIAQSLQHRAASLMVPDLQGCRADRSHHKPICASCDRHDVGGGRGFRAIGACDLRTVCYLR
jgi:hypothetical protein